MISPTSSQVETADFGQQNIQATRYMSLVLATILTTGVIVTRILFNYYDETPLYGSFDPVIIIALWLGVVLIRRGRLLIGTSFMAGVFWSVITAVIVQRTNMGLMLTVSSGFFISALFTYGWPRRLRPYAGLVLSVVSMGLILLDLFWPYERLSIPVSVRPVFFVANGLPILIVAILVIRRFTSFSLRGKLITTFIAITGLPLVALSVGNFIGLDQALTNSANQSLLAASSQTAVTLDDFFRTGQDTIQAEASIMGASYDWAYFSSLTEEERVGPVGILAEEKAISLLIAYWNRDPEHILSYALLDIDGQVLFDYPRTEVKADESAKSYFQRVMNTGTVYASAVEFDAETGQPYFYFSAIVVDNVGQEVGVLRARYDAALLQELITRSTGLVGNESFAVLFDDNNLHLAHGISPSTLYKLVDLPTSREITALQNINRLPDKPTTELTTSLPKLSLQLKLASSTPIFEAVDVVDLNRVNQVGVAFMEELPWKVAYFQPQDVYLAPEITLIRQTVLLTILAIAAVAGVAVVIANYIAQPIIELEQVANKVAQGDLTARAPDNYDSEAGALALAFNSMTAQIQDSVTNLENRVLERTRALEVSNQVSQKLSTILSQKELVATAVNQIRDAFDYYHAHIYLLDETGQNLMMVGGTGQAGTAMLDSGHQVSLGQGLVGQAAFTQMPVLAPDVSQEEDWLPNPLLPDTKAETAVPIIYGDDLLGVLDVQHNVVDGLQQSDVALLESIASQVAIALQNARAYERTQQKSDQEARFNEINRTIQSTTDVETALQVAVRELGRVLDTKQVRVQLQSGQNGRNEEGKSDV